MSQARPTFWFKIALFPVLFCAVSLCLISRPRLPASSATSAPALAPTQAVFCGLWRTDNAFVSTIHIKNSLITGPLQVVPALYMADGTEYDLSPLRLDPGGIATVSVNEALANASFLGGHQSQYGSAALRYQYSASGVVAGEAEILNAPASLIFKSPFLAVGGAAAAHTLEGLWWKRDPGVSGFVSFANTSDQPKELAFQAAGSGGTMLPQQSLTLGAHVTQMLDLDALLVGLPTQEAAAGGLRIQFIGMMGDVIVTGGLKNEREGFSASIPFLMHDTGNNGPIAITYASVGMLVGQPNPAAGFPTDTQFAPYAVLRNTASVALQVSPSLYHMAGGDPGALVLPVQNLAPSQVKQIPLEAILASGGLAAYKGDVTLTLSFTGQPGDLVVATGSVDQTGTYVFEVRPQGVGKTLAKDSPFWSVANGSDSMFTLWNPGTTLEDILATFMYTGGNGHYVLPIHLVPKASQTIDVAQLIALRQPDGEGNIIPANVQGGSVRFSGTNGPTQPINLVVSGGIFNVQTATCGTTCFCCFGVVLFDISPNPFICPFQTSGQATATETMTDGSKRDVSSQASWSSTNTSVATVSSTGLVYGAGVGSANIRAEINDFLSGNYCDGIFFICPLFLLTATIPENTTPVITSISPSRGLIGATTSSVTITGQGFTGGHVNTPAAIQVANITTFTDTQIVLDLVVSSTANPGNNSISITASGQESNKVNFFVQVPTSLSIVSPKTGSEGPCTVQGSSGCGTVISFTYQVNDQDSPPKPINAVMSFWDSFGTTSPDPLLIDQHGGYATTCTPANTGPCNKFTRSSGQFDEMFLGACSSVCLMNGACTTGGPSKVNQTWHIGTSSIVQQISIFCEKVLVNGQ